MRRRTPVGNPSALRRETVGNPSGSSVVETDDAARLPSLAMAALVMRISMTDARCPAFVPTA